MNRFRKIFNYYKANYKIVLIQVLLVLTIFNVITYLTDYMFDMESSFINLGGIPGLCLLITLIVPTNINWYGKFKINRQTKDDINFDVSFEIKYPGQFDKLYRLYISKEKIYLKNQYNFNNYDIEVNLEDIRKINIKEKRVEFTLKKYSPLYIKSRYSEQIKNIIENYIEKKQQVKEVVQ